MTLALDLSGIQWSPQQRAVFAEVEHGTGHLIVEALAGTGKTTTVIEALNRLPRGGRYLLCAFNRSIADELEARAPKGVKVQTLHGLGNGALFAAWGKCPIDNARGRRHVSTAIREWKEGRATAPQIVPAFERALCDVVAMCKAKLVSTPEEIEAEVRRGSLPCPEGMTDADACAIVARALDLALQADGTVSFDDMVYVPAALGIRPRAQYDVVFVDETQDMSRAQLELACLALRPGGRLVLVGDRNQAIYGWRGADVGAMDRMAEQLDATVLPLSVTRRCPRAVVALAQRVVPAFEVAPNAGEGVVRSTALQFADWTEGDLVVSRLNAPLTRCALSAIRAGKRARIQGRDIGQNLRTWIQSFAARTAADLVKRAREWVRVEQAKLEEEDATTAEELLDRVETLEALTEGCSTTAEVIARLESLFSDEDGPGLLFSSTHRAKGMERRRVFVLAWTFKPAAGGEAACLWYVAITRAQQELVLVSHPSRPVADAIVTDAMRFAR